MGISSVFNLVLVLLAGFEICSNMNQFEEYERLYFDLAKKDKCHVENTTGCLYPCSYHEYRIADKQVLDTCIQ